MLPPNGPRLTGREAVSTACGLRLRCLYMFATRRAWQEELEIVDRTLREISGVSDPEQLINTYWNGIGKLIPANDYIALSRRDVARPNYLITRSSRFAQNVNPWTQREKLPLLSGGVLGEIIYANRP